MDHTILFLTENITGGTGAGPAHFSSYCEDTIAREAETTAREMHERAVFLENFRGP